MNKTRTVGYMVMADCDDFVQPLSMHANDKTPEAGILDWADKASPAHLFPSRAAARAAIDRTHHYAVAFGRVETLPQRAFCKIQRVVQEQSE